MAKFKLKQSVQKKSCRDSKPIAGYLTLKATRQLFFILEEQYFPAAKNRLANVYKKITTVNYILRTSILPSHQFSLAQHSAEVSLLFPCSCSSAAKN